MILDYCNKLHKYMITNDGKAVREVNNKLKLGNGFYFLWYL